MEDIFVVLVLISLFLLVIGLINPKASLFWYKKNKNRKISTLIYFSSMIVFFILFGITTESKKEEAVNLTIKTAEYEIIKIEDQSRKALGKKLLSQYQISEIEELPINKRVLYRIILSKDVKENQIKPTVEKIIKKLTSDNSKIDEIILWFYSNKEALNNPYDIGSVIWAPNGELGNINPSIAKGNNRDNYKIEYKIKENLEEYLLQKSKSEIRFGLTENKRKQFFKDIVKAEDKANEYKRKEEDKVFKKKINSDQLKTQLLKIQKEVDILMKNYKSKVLNKYNISEEQELKISEEAFSENWLLD